MRKYRRSSVLWNFGCVVLGALLLVSCSARKGISVEISQGGDIRRLGTVQEVIVIEGVEDTIILVHGGILKKIGSICRLNTTAEYASYRYNFADSCDVGVMPRMVCIRGVRFVGYDSGAVISVSGCALRVSKPIMGLNWCTREVDGIVLCQDERGQIWQYSSESIWKNAAIDDSGE